MADESTPNTTQIDNTTRLRYYMQYPRAVYYKPRLHESSNPGSTHFRSQTEFQSTNGCGSESIQVTIQVGGVHTGGKSGLNPC